MPKGSHSGKSRRSRKRRPVRHFVPPVSGQTAPSEGAAVTARQPLVRSAQPTLPVYPYLSADLKKIGIIAGIAFVLLIVLSLVL